MKLRRDFLLAVFILFAIPVIGYFVLQRAAYDRMKISATLQPKDSISLDLKVQFLNAEGAEQTEYLVNLPYVLKVIGTKESIFDITQIEHIMYIINDRTDLAFMMYEPELEHTVKTRMMGYRYANSGEDMTRYGDVLLVDVFNRILQIYDRDDPELYKKLLEDISYAFPMVDYQIDKRNQNAKQSSE